MKSPAAARNAPPRMRPSRRQREWRVVPMLSMGTSSPSIQADSAALAFRLMRMAAPAATKTGQVKVPT